MEVLKLECQNGLGQVRGDPSYDVQNQTKSTTQEQGNPFPFGVGQKVPSYTQGHLTVKWYDKFNTSLTTKPTVICDQELNRHIDIFMLVVQAEVKFLLKRMPLRKQIILREGVQAFMNKMQQLKHSDIAPRRPLGLPVTCPVAPTVNAKDPRHNLSQDPEVKTGYPVASNWNIPGIVSECYTPDKPCCVFAHKRVRFLDTNGKLLSEIFKTDK